MATISLNSNSTTLKLKNVTLDSERVVTDFIAGDIIVIAPVNAQTSRTYSAEGVNIQGRVDKDVRTITFTVEKFGDTDEFMNEAIYSGQTCVFEGSAKSLYFKDGEQRTETYSFKGGSITTLATDTKNNRDGNNEMTYVIEARVTRDI